MASYEELKKQVKSYRQQKGEQTQSGRTKTYEELKQEVKQYRFQEDVRSVDQNYIQRFMDFSNDFFSSAQKDYANMGWDNAGSLYQKHQSTMDDLEYRRLVIDAWRSSVGDSLDAATSKSLSETMSLFRSDSSKVMSALAEARDFYDPEKNQDAYLAYVDRQNKLNYDLGAGQKKIDDLNRAISLAKDIQAIGHDVPTDITREYDAILRAYGLTGNEDLKELMSAENVMFSEAKRTQEGVRLSSVADSSSDSFDPEFEKLGVYVPTEKKKLIPDYEDIAYELINGNKNVNLASGQAWGKISDAEYTRLLTASEHMNDSERALYNYWYAKGGYKAAEAYLDSIMYDLNTREASGRYGDIEGKTALELLHFIPAGFDQANTGIESLFNTNGEYRPPTATQMVSGAVREDLGNTGPEWVGKTLQTVYDAGTTITNMAPSILTSIAIGTINPAAGAWAGNAILGGSAAGNAYQEKLNLGYSKEQARSYGLMIGASEIVMEKLLGGISKLGGGMLSNTVLKNLDNVDNILAKVAKSTGGKILMNAGSEALEEGLQSILEPYIWQAVSGEDASVDWQEALYSSLLGFITGGVFEGANAAFETVSLNNETKQKYGAVQGEVVTEALEIDPDSNFAQRMQSKLDNGKDLSGSQINKLLKNNEAGLVKNDIASIQKAAEATLVKYGETGDVKVISEALAKQVTGKSLTRAEKTAISESKYGQRVANELNPENIQSGDFNTAWAESIDTDRINAEEYSRLVQDAELDVADTAPEGTAQPDASTVIPLRTGEINEADSTISAEAQETTSAPVASVSIEEVSKKYGAQAKAMVATYNQGQDVAKFDRAYGIAYEMGKSDVGVHYAVNSEATSYLTQAQRELAYVQGSFAGKNGAKSLDAKNKPNGTGNGVRRKGAVKLEGIKASEFRKMLKDSNDPRGKAAKVLMTIAEVTGIDIVLFKSQVDASGRYVGEQGRFEWKDDTIYIDVNAGLLEAVDTGEYSKYIMLRTFGHEFTHFMEKNAATQYTEFRKLVFAEMTKKGENVDYLVKRKQLQYKDEKLSYEAASREVVADAMGDILRDSKFVENLAQKHNGLFKTLLDQFKRFIRNIRSYFNSIAGNPSPEAKALKEEINGTMKYLDSIVEMFDKVAMEAVENYQQRVTGEDVVSELTPGEEGVVVDKDGEPVAYSTEDGTVMLSIRTYEDEGRAEFRKYLEKCVKNKSLTKEEMQDMMDGIEEVYSICKEFKDKYAPFSAWSDAEVIRDTKGKPVFSVVTPNGEYKMNLDFSLVCKKRRTLDAVFNEMAKRGIIDDFELGKKTVVKINELIRKYKFETACNLCFVDAKRYRQADVADSVVRLYNDLVQSLVPEEHIGSIERFNFAGYATIKPVADGIHTWPNSKLDFSHINEVLKQYEKDTVEAKAARYIKNNPEARKLLLRGDFMSSGGFDAVKSQNQNIMSLYNSKKGTGGPKAAFGDVQYMNEVIKKARWWTPAKAYDVGGVRIQSFSDYVPRMVFDYVQMIYDLAATKLPAHAYTKEAIFVMQFGLTGVKINMSLIPAVVEGGIAPGLDANGNYAWAGESFDFETAKAIQKAPGYSENCGTIAVGVSKKHIETLLRDPDIRMVIPYHKSGLNPVVAHMNKIAEFTDYTSLKTNPKGCQSTMDAEGNKVEKDFDFNKTLRAVGDPKLAADKYLQWCDDPAHGYTPKFAEFRREENYYKLLVDFTVYDESGTYVPQREVRAVFPKEGETFGSMKDLIKSGLKEDALIQGKRDALIPKMVDEIERTIARTEAEIPDDEQVEQADHDVEAELMDENRVQKQVRNNDSDRDFLTEDVKRNLTVSEISEMFDAWNSDAETAELAKKVFAKLQSIQDEHTKASWGKPYGIRFATEAEMEKAFYTATHGVFVKSTSSDFYGITYNIDRFKKFSNQERANVILHEAIHACTERFIHAAESKIPKHVSVLNFRANEDWSEEVKAGLSLIQIFEQVRTAEERIEYGQIDAHEMTAELANPEFRKLLKKQNLWERVVNAIKSILGIGTKTNALDAASKALDRILQIDNVQYSKRTYDSVEEMDSDYLDAVDSEDVETQKQMVAEAAKRAMPDTVVVDTKGDLMLMYHGTANGGAFTVFEGNKLSNESRTSQIGQGFYFTNSKADAEAYTKNVDIYGRVSKGSNPHLHQVYLNITNPFDVRKDTLDLDKVKSVYMDGGYDYFYDNWIPFYLDKKSVNGKTFTKADLKAMSREDRVSAFVDYYSKFGSKEVLSNMVRAFGSQNQGALLESMKNILGYDGIVEEYKPGLFQYVAFSSEQIKSADPVTYDDNGSVIPLSERFNEENNDIRYQKRTNTLTDHEILDMAARDLDTSKLTDAEKTALGIFQKRVDKLKALKEERQKQGSIFYEHQFGANKDTAKATAARNRMTVLDKQITKASAEVLGLEDKKILKDVLQKSRKVIEQKERKESLERIRVAREETSAKERKIANEKLEALRQKKNERIAEVRAEERQKAQERLDNLREKKNERIAEVRAEERERATERVQNVREGYQSSRLREKIKAFKAKLEKNLLNPTERQYVPAGLTQAMIDVVNLIDIDTDLVNPDGTVNKAQERRNETKMKLSDLAAEYERLKSSDPVYAGEFDEAVYNYLTELRDNFAGRHLREMTLGELTEMYEILRSIEETLQDARKLIGWGDAETVYEAGDSIIAEQNAITAKRKYGKRTWQQEKRDNSLALTLSPVRYVERMSGYHQSSYLLRMFKAFEKGIRKKNLFKMQAYKSFEALTSRQQYEDAIYTPVGSIYTDANGRSFRLSKMQMMQAILSLEREQANNMSHIEGSGFSFADLDMLKKGNLKDAISEEHSHRVPNAVDMVGEFIDLLKNDKWAQDYMTAARKFFNETAKDAINETSLALKHRIVAKDKSYIPFEVDKNFIVNEISAANDVQQTINSYGMLKDTKKFASNPLIITGLNNILDRHIEQVGNIYGLAIEVRNFNKVWNVRGLEANSGDPTVKATIQRNWGDKGLKLVEQAVQDIQGPRHNSQSELYKKIKSGYIGATFLLNLSVVTKQVGSLFSATSMLRWRGPVRQIGNLLYTMTHSKKLSAEVDKYTASAWMRRQGLSDAEVYTLMTEGKKTWLGRLANKAPAVVNPTKWITAMDHAVALSLWKYAKEDTAKRTGLKGEELLRATAEFYDEVVENTQSMTDVLHRPEIQKRSDVISESFGMFKTDLYQMAGQFLVSGERYHANKTKENGKALARTAYAVTMSAVWAQLMTAVFAMLRYKVDQYRDDEDKDLTAESWMKRQGFSLIGDFAGYIFPLLGSELVGVFENIVYGESDELVDSLGITAINNAYDAALNVISPLTKGEMPKTSDLRKFTTSTLQMFGVPADNILRTLDAIQLHAKDIANGRFLSFEAGVQRSSTHHANRIMEAVEKGNMDLANALFEEAVEEAALKKSEDGSISEEALKDAQSSLQTAFGKKYKDGEISAEQAEKILVDLFGKSEDDAFWIIRAWDTGDSSKYSAVFDAALSGTGFNEALKEMTDHGYEKDDVLSKLKTQIKTWYTDEESETRITKQQAMDMLKKYVGMSSDEVTSTINQWSSKVVTGIAYDDIKDEFMAGKMTASRAIEMRVRYGGKTKEDATAEVSAWNAEKKYGLSSDIAKAYTKTIKHIGKSAEQAGIKADVFTRYKELCKTAGSKKEDIMDIIHSLPLTVAQKDALYYQNGWSEKTIDEAPWHQ